MPNRLLPLFRAIAPLQLIQLQRGEALLRSRGGFVRISAAGPGIFRLQHAPTKLDLDRPSWAVARTVSAPVDPTLRIHTRNSSVTLSSPHGCLSLLLNSGAWTVQDAAGSSAFEGEKIETSATGLQFALRLSPEEIVHGLGETTGTFNKRGLVREFWNIDVLGHAPAMHPGLRTLYTSIPFAISLREGRAAGVFWDNPARQLWDIGQTELSTWRLKASSPVLDLYFFLGPELDGVLRGYTDLTGRMPLPPRWGLGYQQCRYSYETAERVEAVARTFRKRRIPCDAIYLDIHHMDGYRVFTFGKSFPHPAALCARLRRQGFKVVTIVDPGVKNDPRFGVLRRGKQAGAFVKAPGSKADFVGRVWPGPSRFPDFLNPKARRWWGTEQRRLLAAGVSGIWNDMNEPANFASDTKTLPEQCRHESDHGPVPHALGHNVYGMQMARASRAGALAHAPQTRPFIITRAAYAGTQRYALVWTGDNSSAWEHLNDSVQMLLNLSLSGVAFCGADVGGFIDNSTPELLTRWMQLAVFTPFLRNHSNIRTLDQEPWAFGEPTESVCRRYVELRYQLLPYLYGLFAEAHASGAPIMRPMSWHFQKDPVAARLGDQFLLGPNLLVAPVLRQGAVARSVYLPQGAWYDFWTGAVYQGPHHVVAEAPLERIPLFVPAGAILPMGPVRQYVSQRAEPTVNLHIWPGTGQLEWYEDDGRSQGYDQGEFHRRRIQLAEDGQGLSLRFGVPAGSFASRTRQWRIVLRSAARRYRVRVNGRNIPSRYDRSTALLSAVVANVPEAFEVQLL